MNLPPAWLENFSRLTTSPSIVHPQKEGSRRGPKLNWQSTGLWLQWLWVRTPSATPFFEITPFGDCRFMVECRFLFWPDAAEVRTRNNLRHLLHQPRQTFPALTTSSLPPFIRCTGIPLRSIP